jgi:hypothetical protein
MKQFVPQVTEKIQDEYGDRRANGTQPHIEDRLVYQVG